MHGELRDMYFNAHNGFGSSPRAWGTPDAGRRSRAGSRFIPTCMGNSVQPSKCCRGASVHPHVHGELFLPYRMSKNVLGSSPRAWGTPYMNARSEPKVRFIPTCMGNSTCMLPIYHDLSVHPHVHGELRIRCIYTYVCIGSSPRAWGTPISIPAMWRVSRFIPTCMGNSRGIAGR